MANGSMSMTATVRRPAASLRRTQAERTALSDARMLEAAVRLIGERGTERTTLKDVGELAGYSRGLAGYRFGSKENLFAFVVRAIGEEWLRELTAVTAGRVGLAAIEAATDAHYRFVADAPEHVRAFYILWFEAIGPQSQVREVIARIHDRRRRDVEGWIRGGQRAGEVAAGVDAKSLAAQFCAAVTGIVYQWLVDPRAMEEIRALHAGLKQTMRVLLPPPTAGERSR